MRMQLMVLVAVVMALVAGARAEEKEVAGRGQWIVVTSPGLKEGIMPLVEFHKKNGMHVEVVVTSDLVKEEDLARGEGGEKIREKIAALVAATKERSYVLVNGPAMMGGEERGKFIVPALKGTIGRMKGEWSDNGYGTVGAKEGDVMPAVAVGRLPAHSATELDGMVTRILGFELVRPKFAAAEVRMIIGDPGGDSIEEKTLAAISMQGEFENMVGRLHPRWETKAVVDIKGMPQHVAADKLPAALDDILHSSGFVVYAGHSNAEGMVSNGKWLITRGEWSNDFAMTSVFVSCGCYALQAETGKGGEGEGYGITAMRNKAGPAAVIGASGESAALAGKLAFEGMLGDMSKAELPERMGDLFLDLKAGIAAGKVSARAFAFYDKIDGSNGKVPLDVQRKEHLEMWALLGDPAMGLTFPKENIEFAGPVVLTAGKETTIVGTLPKEAAGAEVEVFAERIISDEAHEIGAARVTVKADGQRFEAKLTLDAGVPWDKVIVRARTKAGVNGARGSVFAKVERAADLPKAKTAPAP